MTAIAAAAAAGPGRPLTQFLSYRILRLHLALNAQAVAVLERADGPSLGQWRILAMLASGSARTSRELAERTQFDPAFISRTIRSMEDEGLVASRRGADDRRVLELEVTAQGLEIYRRVLPRMQARQQALLDALSPGERDAIFRIIDKLELAAGRRDFEA